MAEEKPKGSASESEEKYTFDPKEIGRRLVTPLDELGLDDGEIERRIAEAKKKIEETKDEILEEIDKQNEQEQKTQGEQSKDKKS